ncbi:MAG TPA: type II and III secretion system protein family protein [Solimonas sp.]|nr:type II and III secretion system protein family protein [Solimonas sp.]
MKNKIWAVVAGLALGLMPLLPAAAAGTDASAGWVEVEQGFHKIIRDNRRVLRVATGDPAVADVTVGGLHDVLVNGKKLGITSLTIWPAGAAPREFRVRVVPAKYPRTAASKADPELGSAQINPGQGLEGRLPNLAAHRRAKLAALPPKEGAVADSSDVVLGTQVQTSVKIAELSRSTAQRFGLNLFKSSNNTVAGIGAPGSLAGIDGANGGITLESSSGFQAFRDAYGIVFGNPRDGLVGLLNVLEGKGLARVLAEPTLLATSGQTASYLVGGEFPIPVVQGGSQSNSVTVEYKEFGVRLSLTPTVLSRDRIALKVAPEVSDIDFSAGIQTGGVTVPALRVRRTETSIELGDGESFVISGLVSNTLRRNIDKVPWLGQLPILGAFFRATQLDQEERELIMVVTPHLVRPLAREAKLPPLPGAKYGNYRPSAGQLVFEETGDSDVGFSK